MLRLLSFFFMQRRLCNLHAHLLIASACEHNVFGGRGYLPCSCWVFCSAAGVLYLTISGLASVAPIKNIDLLLCLSEPRPLPSFRFQLFERLSAPIIVAT